MRPGGSQDRRLSIPPTAAFCPRCGSALRWPVVGCSGADALRPLQGVWVMVSFEIAAGRMPAREARRYHLLVRGEFGLLTYRSEWAEFRVRLDPAASPAAMDWEYPGRLVLRCVYELLGDDLRVCRAADFAAPRPAAFSTGEGVLLGWRREPASVDFLTQLFHSTLTLAKA